MEDIERIQRETIANQILRETLEMVESKYGTGQGDGETPLAYHNVLHTKGVLSAAEQIADAAIKAGKIEPNDKILVSFAACFHDLEQSLGSGANERASAAAAEAAMRKAGIFSDIEIQKVMNMIMATQVHFENGKMRQSESDDYLTKILTDADLAHLGQEGEVYWSSVLALLREIKKTDHPTTAEILAFAQIQPGFLGNHKFHTPEAEILFAHKENNIKLAQEKILELQASL
jgi:predicted metal-dependent HD superfamily phosphohydrolase